MDLIKEENRVVDEIGRLENRLRAVRLLMEKPRVTCIATSKDGKPSKISTRLQDTLDFIAAGTSPVTTRQIAAVAGIANSGAIYRVQCLVKYGLVEAVGDKTNRTWKLA